MQVAVIGGGAFGTAMASAAARAGHEVTIWALEDEAVAEINEQHTNSLFLPNVPLDPGIRATTEIGAACAEAELVLLVPPAQHFRSVGAEVQRALRPKTPAAICSKGIEQKTGALLSEVAADVLPGHAVAVLSGPMFADEVARGLPAAATIAAADEKAAAFIAKSLRTRNLKLYTSDDVLGAQLGGAVKNVLAIASGITVGLELGHNTRAAIITRGLAEMARLGVAKGARPETMLGLSGAGDLMLTCFSEKSRNTSLGMALAQGRTLEQIMGERRSVSEGVYTAEALVKLSKRLGVDMPITTAVHGILQGKHTPAEAMEDLLSRPLRREWT